MTARLEVRDLEITTADGGVLVSGLSLSIEPGGLTALVGESGSGKTLTALAVLDLLPAGLRQTRGDILFDGTDVTAYTPAERRAMLGRDMSMIFQEPMTALDPVMRMVGPVFRTLFRIERPVRDAQPAVRDGRVRIGRSHEGDFLSVRIEHPEDQEQIGVLGG